MKTKIPALLVMMCLGMSFIACTPTNIPLSAEQLITPTPFSVLTNTVPATQVPTSQETQRATSTVELTTPVVSGLTPDQPLYENALTKTEIPPEMNALTNIIILIGGSSFSAKLYDNETTRALLAKFPLEVNMDELYGREKYFFLPENLPFTYAETPKTIHAGEIMLWSSNCLVVFYNTFPNTVSGYVKLGYIEDVAGLADALGGGSILVTFTVSN